MSIGIIFYDLCTLEKALFMKKENCFRGYLKVLFMYYLFQAL